MPRPASISRLHFFRCQWLLRRMVTQRPKQTNKHPPVYRCYPGNVLNMLKMFKNKKGEEKQQNALDRF